MYKRLETSSVSSNASGGESDIAKASEGSTLSATSNNVVTNLMMHRSSIESSFNEFRNPQGEPNVSDLWRKHGSYATLQKKKL